MGSSSSAIIGIIRSSIYTQVALEPRISLLYDSIFDSITEAILSKEQCWGFRDVQPEIFWTFISALPFDFNLDNRQDV